MLTRLRFALAATFVAYLGAVSAYGQEVTPPSPAPAPAHLAFVEGLVDVVQEGVTSAAEPPVILIEGDIVRTRQPRHAHTEGLT